MSNFAPCPKCNGNDSEKMSFTWWGGIIGPKILTHVKCKNCGEEYNGKSGKSNTTNIIIYCVVVGVIAFALIAAFIIFAIAVAIMTQ